tara:strand:+ start:28 stop:1428 length:1401 start_codon:yes stop_codon:yes gene_type:complete
MSQTIIEQSPLFDKLPVGQDVIFTVSNNSIVSDPNFSRVKFQAEVHISSDLIPNPSVNTDVVGIFKTNPNNAGVGMFDLRPIIESFVKADNLAREGSAYKEAVNTADTNVPMHLIDKYSGNLNTMRYLAIQFKTEYFDGTNIVSVGTAVNSIPYKLINGYLKYTDGLTLTGNNFGYDLLNFNFELGEQRNFLTNAPSTQYANINDYGTMALLMSNPFTPNNTTGSKSIKFSYFDVNDNLLGGDIVDHNIPEGGFNYPNSTIQARMLFAGVFPANLQNWSTVFQNKILTISYYTFSVISTSSSMSELYRININCPTLKGFEPIRLTWLNQWGAWDYYTFTMKSSKMISTKGSTYEQLEGSWNESTYKIDSFKGGKKAFRVNATEKITMNTNFISESESAWFEELINSPEVYILEGYKDDATDSALNKYVTPVRLTTSSYTKKTVANDKIIQYTFEVEKSKTLRTQSI